MSSEERSIHSISSSESLDIEQAVRAEDEGEEECIICLDLLSSEPWGRVEDCGHAFHKRCWFDWENAQRALRHERNSSQEGVKCCLCNQIATQFVCGQSRKPEPNPNPYTPPPPESPATNNSSNDRHGFGDWFREMVEQAGDFFENLGANVQQQQQHDFPFRIPRFSTPSTGFNTLNSGTAVMTHSLNSAQMNGKRGVIVRQQPSGRYLVRLEQSPSLFSTATSVAIKPENLLQTAIVKIFGIRSEPRLNGKEGEVIGYSSARNRYIVQVSSLFSAQRDLSLKPDNIRIQNGTCVRLQGLSTAVQWNGKYGRLTRWDSSVGRYDVQLSRQYSVRVKPNNVML